MSAEKEDGIIGVGNSRDERTLQEKIEACRWDDEFKISSKKIWWVVDREFGISIFTSPLIGTKEEAVAIMDKLSKEPLYFTKNRKKVQAKGWKLVEHNQGVKGIGCKKIIKGFVW
jgi:hypothetical protein